jgi:hypothetical protein
MVPKCDELPFQHWRAPGVPPRGTPDRIPKHLVVEHAAALPQIPNGRMRKPRIVRLKQPPVTVTLLDSEMDELIECVANAADRAESGSYDMAGTPKAKSLAKERAKRLYALASRLETARDRRG